MSASWVLLIMIQVVASARFGSTVLSLCDVPAIGSMNNIFGNFDVIGIKHSRCVQFILIFYWGVYSILRQ